MPQEYKERKFTTKQGKEVVIKQKIGTYNCSVCNKDISYSSKSSHNKSIKHLKLLNQDIKEDLETQTG